MQREYHKPRVGVSSCLLGDAVRYDGGHKRHAWLADVFGLDVEWVSVCPEVEIGLGIPREPIDLVRMPDGAVHLMTSNMGLDLTDRMRQFAVARIGALAAIPLSGYVLKASSPSCGLSGVRVVGGDATGRGLFAAALVERCPDLPIVDERQLDDAAARGEFAARVFAYHAKIQP